MRPLVIDDTARAKANAIVAYARVNPYSGSSTDVPGDNPNHVAVFNTYRTVFSFTRDNGGLYRHLSVSVPSSKLPNPIAVWMLAELFGFTGWTPELGMKPGPLWQVGLNEADHCAVVLQKEP